MMKLGLSIFVVVLMGAAAVSADDESEASSPSRTKRYIDDRYLNWRPGSGSPPFYGYGASYHYPYYRNYPKRGLGAARNTGYGTWYYQSPDDDETQKRGFWPDRVVPYYDSSSFGGDRSYAGSHWSNMEDGKRVFGPTVDARYRNYGSPFYVDPPGGPRRRYRRDVDETGENEAVEDADNPEKKRYLGIALFPWKIASKQKYHKPGGKRHIGAALRFKQPYWHRYPNAGNVNGDGSINLQLGNDRASLGSDQNEEKRHQVTELRLHHPSIPEDDSYPEQEKRHLGAALRFKYEDDYGNGNDRKSSPEPSPNLQPSGQWYTTYNKLLEELLTEMSKMAPGESTPADKETKKDTASYEELNNSNEEKHLDEDQDAVSSSDSINENKLDDDTNEPKPKTRVKRHLASLVASRPGTFPAMTKYQQSYYLKPHNYGFDNVGYDDVDPDTAAKAKYFQFMSLLMRYQLKNFLKTMD